MTTRSSPVGAAYVPGLFSVVIPTRNEGAMLGLTTDSVLSSTEWPDVEVIVVDDGSTDDSIVRYRRSPDPRLRILRGGGLGVAKARNLGAQHARGEYVVFLDAHCTVSSDWLDRFALALAEPGVALVSPCFTRLGASEPRGCGIFFGDAGLEQHWFEPRPWDTPYDVPLNIGACQALRRDVFDGLGRYDTGFGSWGFEDVELCLRAWLFGWRVQADPVATVAHQFRESRGYEVDDIDVVYNFVRMLALHFDEPEFSAILAARGPNPNIGIALERIEVDGTLAQRHAYDRMRVRPVGWFFEHVNTMFADIA
jgi:glycosyltransferase involved in cell wall biosynthesis